MTLKTHQKNSGNVLVVDDDRDIRKVTLTLLKAVGFTTFEAADGEEGLRIAAERPIDVMLLDVSMPGLGGFDVIERVKNLDNPPIVIFVSARNDRDDRLTGLLSGAISYISKPYEPAELIAQVATAVAQKARINEARIVSYRDSLTGLGNRLAFNQRLGSEIARSERYRHCLALVMIDADGLKQVNDTHGHAAGDRLIQAIAQAISSTCRETDCAVRLGGDEFAVVLPEADRKSAINFIDRLQALARLQSVMAGDVAVTPSLSAGYSVYPDDAQDEELLKELADAALYREKRRKKELLHA